MMGVPGAGVSRRGVTHTATHNDVGSRDTTARELRSQLRLAAPGPAPRDRCRDISVPTHLCTDIFETWRRDK